MIPDLDKIVRDPQFLPFAGWHDEYRDKDRTEGYLPAIQQNSAEFYELAALLDSRGLHGKCLQLGLGMPGGSHRVLESLFREVYTIEASVSAIDTYLGRFPNTKWLVAGNTHDWQVRTLFENSDFDFLFIDAGHSYGDVSADFFSYQAVLKPGGIVAIHDALKRPTYENEIQTWQFVEYLKTDGFKVEMIGIELGIAWVAV